MNEDVRVVAAASAFGEQVLPALPGARAGERAEPLLFRVASVAALGPLFGFTVVAGALLWGGVLQAIVNALGDASFAVPLRALLVLTLSANLLLVTALLVSAARRGQRAWRAPRASDGREVVVALAFSLFALPASLACGALVGAVMPAAASPPLLIPPGLAAALTLQGCWVALLAAGRASRERVTQEAAVCRGADAGGPVGRAPRGPAS